MTGSTANWSSKAERGSTALIELIAWLARVAGRPFCRALLYPIVFYFVVADGVARRASAQFLSAVQGRRATLRDVFRPLPFIRRDTARPRVPRIRPA